jgi:hypothetical protein
LHYLSCSKATTVRLGGQDKVNQLIQTVLCQVDDFVKYNAWHENVDSRVAGYTANLHPVHHNREKVQHVIANFLGDMMKIDCDDPFYPEFKVVPSHAGDNKSNKKVSSRFLAIVCRNKTFAAVMRKKLIIAYSNLPTKVDPILGAFIPFDSKFTYLEMFRRLGRRQNQYLAHHRNIPINGLDETILRHILPNDIDLANEIQLKAHFLGLIPVHLTTIWVGTTSPPPPIITSMPSNG